MIRYIFLLSLLLLGSSTLWAQTTGSLRGKITDKENEEPIMLANVVLEKEGNMVTGTQTDFDGNYNFSNIEAGTYDLVVTYIGYQPYTLKNLLIIVGKSDVRDIEMGMGLNLVSVVVEDKKISFGDPITVITEEDIKNNPERGLDNMKTRKAGVNSADEGEDINANGARATSNATYVDGVLVPNGALGISDVDVAQMQVITNGMPAEYGDVTGVITNIITKGPSSRVHGSFQYETSQFLDNFGEHRANAYFSGPIIAETMLKSNGDTIFGADKKTPVKNTVLGYRFSGSYHTVKDPRPSALPTFKLKDHKLKEIQENPLLANPSGSGNVFASDFLTANDLEQTNVRSNAQSTTAQFNGKVEFKPNQDFFFVVGGQGEFTWNKSASVANQLFNYEFNPNQQANMMRFSGRFRHRVSSTTPGSDKADSSLTMPIFQNLSYELQADYTQTNFSREDPRYKDRFWEYGYVGKFYESRRPVIGAVDSVAVLNSQNDTVAWKVATGHAAFFNSFDKYELDWDLNPGLAAYNNLMIQPNQWNDFTNFNPDAPTSINEMEIINGLNTGGRSSAYGLFNAPHLNGSGFAKNNTSQIRANVKANFDLALNQASGEPFRHSIQIGGVFEQRIERSYNINPFDLWNLAYQTTNQHISNAVDQSRPTGEMYYDPLTQRNYALYEALIRTDEEGKQVAMSQFGAKLRDDLGLEKRDWVSVHELTPDQMQLEWFEPTTLITGRQSVLNYYGYDYKGNPLGTNVSFNEFFTATDENGVKTRPIAPHKPIYVAGYIQDRFTFKNIQCNVGFRFDSYDANTSVLKDPYSITGYETAAEFESANSLYDAGQSTEYDRPSNIGDNYAVYVNQNSKDASVMGYRDGRQWYNAQGLPVNSASELGTNFMPALKGMGTAQIDPQGEQYNPNDAFRDYTPTLIIMPRISLGFPITKTAGFFANYDILSQRPPVGAYASPLSYYNFREITGNGGIINNPNLKPERTINYEVGFEQALTKTSKIKLSLLYKEERDLIQLQQYVNAYPNTYTTYGNDDFSTTKAFKLEYDMIRTKNLRVLANYTLQFSDGTGSSPTSSAGVAAKELKYIFPLDFDQRHTVFLNVDYRFKSGMHYNGPCIGHFELLGNTGFSMTVHANSGRPYTRKEIPGGIGTSFQDRITDGSINGARTPWNVRVGLKIDRSFVVGKNTAKPLRFNVYLRITNLLNTQNVLGVYSTTGSPVDDGFLTTANSPGPGFASSQPESYEMLYNLRMNNPYNISRPRRIFLGVSFNF